MLKVVVIMLCGVAAGYCLRKKDLSFVSRLITLAIWGLLFLLGISVGSNQEILDNFHTLGLQAVMLTLGGVAGSVGLAWVVYHYFFSQR